MLDAPGTWVTFYAYLIIHVAISCATKLIAPRCLSGSKTLIYRPKSTRSVAQDPSHLMPTGGAGLIRCARSVPA
jgi:hypothetical protein